MSSNDTSQLIDTDETKKLTDRLKIVSEISQDINKRLDDLQIKIDNLEKSFKELEAYNRKQRQKDYWKDYID